MWPHEIAEKRFALYRIVTGVLGLFLVVATFQLWLPQTQFPQVPLVATLPFAGTIDQLPAWLQYVPLSLMLVGLGSMAVSGTKKISYAYVRNGVFAFAIGFPIAVLFDQHRLQPWGLQFFALSLLFAGYKPISLDTAASQIRMGLARILVLGIYFWSAIGKVDYQFAHTVGPEMLSVPFGLLGIDSQQIDIRLLAIFALMLPLAEFAAAFLLAIPRTRPVGVALAIIMHLALLIILGPLGLNHRPGVLLWNVFSLIQVWLLFWPIRMAASKDPSYFESGSPAASQSIVRSLFPVYSALTITAMIVLPVVERWGFYDHWPSWALYAPHSSRVTLLIPKSEIASLPQELQPLIRQPDENLYVSVPLDRWSLETLRAPIYPQSRFELGVALAVIQYSGLERQAKLIVRGPASRMTGKRESNELDGLYEMKKAGEQYWLNAQPAINKFRPKP